MPSSRDFVDRVRINVRAGGGGNGSASFHREKFRPKGGPDGGNGGHGGSIILRADPNVATLADLARSPHRRAERGAHGHGNTRHGAAGEDLVVLVPPGTVVTDDASGEVVADLVAGGMEVVAARGGRGGRGNAALVTPRRRHPGFAELGEEGEDRWLSLELKMLADVGLVGFPNAGKSSLVAAMTAARPKIAAYPFTTLTPNLGVAGGEGDRFVVADVPGLIEGASEGRGLGHDFLRHLERCRVLCFVVDLGEGEAAEPLEALRAELRAYRDDLAERPGVLAANKIDVPGAAERIDAARAAAGAAGLAFVAVSAETGAGVEELSRVLGSIVDADRAAEPAPRSHTLYRIRPEEHAVEVERDDDGAWLVRSVKAERLIKRLPLENPEAISYLQDKLIALGVERALEKAGAQRGDDVRIGGMTFEFIPEHAMGGGE